MIMNKNFKLHAEIILIVLEINIGLISFHLPITSRNGQDLLIEHESSNLHVPQTYIDPNVQKIVEKKLTSFNEGFIKQGVNGDPNIHYFIQNPYITVGFGNGTIKMLVKDNYKIKNSSLTEIEQTFLNSNKVAPIGLEPSDSYSTYYTGSNQEIKRQEYAILVYKNLYDHINLEYTIKNGNLKYNFYVYPGGNPKDIQIRWNGPITLLKTIEGIRITIQTEFGLKTLLDNQPFSYQEGRANRISTEFIVHSNSTYGFTLNNYDPNQLLIIDPTIMLMSTYVGGSNDDESFAIAVDQAGNAYVTGYTSSTNFPAINAYNNTFNGIYDTFVFKYSALSQTLVYSTYVGGSDDDEGWGIAVDVSGNAYVTGATKSSDFPTVNANKSTYSGSNDVFVFKLSESGSSLLYSTYVGGSNSDWADAIAVDLSGNVYVSGLTSSTNFPVVNANQSTNKGGPDAFVFKLSASGLTLLYSTFVGGTYYDEAWSIAVDLSGNAFITGVTSSSDFPMVQAINSTFGGSYDVFVSKLSASGLTLLYSTYVGGSGDDEGIGIGIDSNGNAYVTGFTSSSDFPMVQAINSTFGGSYDAFVLKLDASGSTIDYSTYLGGSDVDEAFGIAVDSSGNAYITGYTRSSDFPTFNAYNSTYGGNADVFVSKLSTSGSTLLYSTYVGGSSDEGGLGVAIDSSGNAFVSGFTNSNNYPTINGYNNTFNGINDVIVFKLATTTNASLTPTVGEAFESNTLKAIELVWQSPIFKETFENYNIYRRTATSSYILLGNTTETYYVDNTISLGTMYYYVLTAVYTFGEGPQSNEVVGKVATIPDSPILQVTAGNRSVYLNWSAPTDGGSPIMEYEIYRGTTSGEYYYIGITSNLYFNDTTTNSGTEYFYVIDAVNTIGKGPYSLEKSAVPYGPQTLEKTVTTIITTTITQPGKTTTAKETSTLTKTKEVSNSTSSSQAKGSSGFESFSVIMILSLVALGLVYKRRNN